MCLTIPGRVVRVEGIGGGTPTAIVDFEGVVRSASLIYLPETRPGDFVLVQAGFAITRVPEPEALEALALARQPIPPTPPSGPVAVAAAGSRSPVEGP